MEVRPGEERIVRRVSLGNSADSRNGGPDGRRSNFNEAGQFVFRAEFEHGSEGIFIADTNSGL